MSLDAHIRELGERHRKLEKEIAAEVRRPAGDQLHLAELKRRKLRIKDQIRHLQPD